MMTQIQFYPIYALQFSRIMRLMQFQGYIKHYVKLMINNMFYLVGANNYYQVSKNVQVEDEHCEFTPTFL